MYIYTHIHVYMRVSVIVLIISVVLNGMSWLHMHTTHYLLSHDAVLTLQGNDWGEGLESV